MPAARVGDRLTCVGPPDNIVMGESSVLIDNKPAARVGDPTAHGGVIVAGCGCVQIGRVAQAIVLKEAAKSGAAFCEECARKKAAADAKKKAKGAKKTAEHAAGDKKGARSGGASRLPAGARPPPAGAKPPRFNGTNTTGRAIDVQKAVDYLDTYARETASGNCAYWVNSAVQAGGIQNYGYGHAYQTGKNLERSGFTPVAHKGDYPNGSFRPEPGDVVVFAPVLPKHDKGHVAMWSGREWVSDFHQKDFYVADAYKSGSFTIYRP